MTSGSVTVDRLSFGQSMWGAGVGGGIAYVYLHPYLNPARLGWAQSLTCHPVAVAEAALGQKTSQSLGIFHIADTLAPSLALQSPCPEKYTKS